MRVAIFSPGDMGGPVGGALHKHGYEVVGDLSGRSQETRDRAIANGFVDAGSVKEAVRGADLVLSILAPALASETADAVLDAIEATGARPVCADCNAISPESTREIGRRFQERGLEFIDCGIIGSPPSRGTPRFYASGPNTAAIAELDGKGIDVRVLDGEIGKASAIKMCFAAITKGTTALHANTVLAAHSEGVLDALMDEFQESRVGVFNRISAGIPGLPAVAGRFEGEMVEIASTFESAGASPDFHKGAAWVMRQFANSEFAHETRASRDHSRSMTATIKSIQKQLQKDGPK